MTESLLAVTEAHKVSELEALAQPLLESPGDLSLQWLAANKWCAVPVESASHFDERDVQLLAEAIKGMKSSVCFGVVAERLENFPHAFQVEVSKEGLLAFSRECAHFNFVLLPSLLSFAVLCTVFDYFIVAGPEPFVESALGCSIAEAQARFRQYAGDSERLIDVARRYEFAC
jgi:hypothetical protein